MTRKLSQIYSPEAEKSVIGAVFLRGDWAFDRANLSADEFYTPAHRETWAALERLVAAKKPVDAVSVFDELERAGRLISVGGIDQVSEYVWSVPTADNVEFYAAIVREKALTRRVVDGLGGVIGRAEMGEDGEDLLARAFEVVSALGSRKTGDAVSMRDAVKRRLGELCDLVDRRQRGEAVTTGIPTGLSDLDEAICGGIPEGVTTILGGRPSDGKSSLARTIADTAAALGMGVHVFSLEDNATAYVDRALSDHARLSLHAMRSVKMDRHDMTRLQEAADLLHRRQKWLIDDTPGLSSALIAMRVRRHRQENGTRLVVVDYVQRLRERGCRDRRAEVEKAANGLDDMARAEGVALLLLSQLSRANAKDMRRPELHDLRESGELEQIAKNVLLVHQVREDSDGNPIAPLGEVIVAKQKDGRRSVVVPLAWDGRTATYRDAPRQEVRRWDLA